MGLNLPTSPMTLGDFSDPLSPPVFRLSFLYFLCGQTHLKATKNSSLSVSWLCFSRFPAHVRCWGSTLLAVAALIGKPTVRQLSQRLHSDEQGAKALGVP